MELLDMLDIWTSSSSSSSPSSLSTSSLSSLSEEELSTPIQRRQFRVRGNPFDVCDDIDFRKRFRLSKELVMEVLHEIGEHLEPSSKRNMPLSAMNQLLLCLRFYACGSFQIAIRDHFNVNKSTACRVVRKVTHYLALLRPKFVKFPETDKEVADTKLLFLDIAGFPGVLGCVDATHVRIQSPGGDDAEVYRNQEGYFSLNVQVVCNAKLEICDVVARWQGSVQDSLIFNASYLCARFEAGQMVSGHLLGDSAYPCRKYLMTPFVSPGAEAQVKYNAAHMQTRNCVARTIGMWKRRFPCLSLGMRTKLETTAAVIVATAVLHNIAVRKDADLQENWTVTDYHGNLPQDDAEGKAARLEIVNTFFK